MRRTRGSGLCDQVIRRTGPHPASGTFVGTVVQPYESPRAHNSHLNQGQIPGMRPPRVPQESSATPIYDALYAEYRRLFRALPGDRTGEEELRFEGFGTVHGTGTGHWSEHAWGGQTSSESAWHAAAAGWHLPALPPAPRDGHR